jgi:hypothetical protein
LEAQYLKTSSKSKKDEEMETVGSEFLRKTILIAFTVLGMGFILVNLSITVLLGHSIFNLEISSQQVVAEISGKLLFILASIALMVVGLLFIIGAIQFYEGLLTKGVVFLGVLFASFYLFCLAVGAMLIQETSFSTLLLLVGSIFILTSAVLYMMPAFPLKIGGAVLGVLGGILLARVIYSTSLFDLAFNWNLPFPGPFMSMVALESVVVILGPTVALVHFLFKNHNEGTSLTNAFLSLIALIYGTGLFIGSIFLSLSFWNWIWKSPWVGPFRGMPSWVLGTVVFWSASLFLVAIGGIMLVVASFLGFVSLARELS